MTINLVGTILIFMEVKVGGLGKFFPVLYQRPTKYRIQ